MSARFDKDDPNVGTGLVGAPACGDVMRLQLKISEDGDHRGREVQDLRKQQETEPRQPQNM